MGEGQLFDDPTAGGADIAFAVLLDNLDEFFGVTFESLLVGAVSRGCIEGEPFRHGRGGGGGRGRVRCHYGVMDGCSAVHDLSHMLVESFICSVSESAYTRHVMQLIYTSV